jgi:DASS family divalent anion:Na+ symporter
MPPPSNVQASIVPALTGLLITPLIMYKLFPPEIKDTPDAPKASGRSLQYECGVAEQRGLG